MSASTLASSYRKCALFVRCERHLLSAEECACNALSEGVRGWGLNNVLTYYYTKGTNAAVVLAIAYILFMRKYYYLHEQYLKSLEK